MLLDKFNNLINSFKNGDNVHSFLNELKEEVDNIKNENIGILERFQSENKVSIGTKNKMDEKLDEILINYAKETSDKGDLYYIVEKTNEEFVIYKYEENNDTVLKLKEEELPENAFVNSALRFRKNNYFLDDKDTLELNNRIIDMANELIEEQNEMLEEYRKEGHLYRVSEKINTSVFLHDITDNPSIEFEEVEFPEDLLDKAVEGVIFEYINGEYKLKGEE